MSEDDLDDFDEDLDEDLEAPAVKTPAIASKQPGTPAKAGGDDISLFFMSTIGPGEKKQKLLINTGNAVGDIKNTVGSILLQWMRVSMLWIIQYATVIRC
ncbi:MAG: hypothetical protein ACTSRK_06510 [Promethearchaeota archaeon]